MLKFKKHFYNLPEADVAGELFMATLQSNNKPYQTGSLM
jgi:hypothetical protein